MAIGQGFLDLNFEEDNQRKITFKFGSIRQSCSWDENQNVKS